MTIIELRAAIDAQKSRSAWEKGVMMYAHELLDNYADSISNNASLDAEYYHDKKLLLSGADNWNQYSWGGCSWIYDCDIAKALCSPSELKKTRDGERRPNAREEWLDIQTRALQQAEIMLSRLSKGGA